MRPGNELARELLRDRVALDEAGEQPFTAQLHHRFRVPAFQGVKGAVAGESPVGHEKVSMGMPLDQVSGGGDGDDDTGLAVWAKPFSDVLGDGTGGALREVEEELSTLAEDPPQEAGHGEDDMAMRNGREHLLPQPLRPQELALLLARRAEGPSATGERAEHSRPERRAPKPREAVFDEATAHEPPQHALDHATQRAVSPGAPRTRGETPRGAARPDGKAGTRAPASACRFDS
jgi:hypothetical protein